MEDPKNATHIEEVELLRLKVIGLQIESLEKERQAMVKALGDKYGAFQAVQGDGSIIRPPTPLAAVPEGA